MREELFTAESDIQQTEDQVQVSFLFTSSLMYTGVILRKLILLPCCS